MNKLQFVALLSTILFITISSCTLSSGTSEDSITTAIAETQQMANLNELIQTSTQLALGPPASDTPAPTNTPRPTSTPEVRKIEDDFAARSEIWGECENCVWEDGILLFGPYPPKGSGQDQIFYVICEACGEHSFYRVAADVSYSEGYGADRTFGILAGLQSNGFLGAGTITTSQHALYETFDFGTKRWGGTEFNTFVAVRPGRATNRIEVTISPSGSPNRADIVVSVNGSIVIQLWDQPVQASKAGLYLGWHSIGVVFDNFDYEVLASG